MRFQVISPMLGPVESYKCVKSAIASLNESFEQTGGLTDRYILDTKTGKPLTRKQVDKYS